MHRFEQSIVIERPPDEVFSFIHDFSRVPDRQPSLIESAQVSEAPLAVGSQIRQVRKFFGPRIESTFEVTEFEPPRQSAFKTTTGPVPMEGRYLLEPVAGGTRLTWRGEIEESGVLRLAEPVFARMAKRELETSFAHLKDLLETKGESESRDG